MGKRRKKKKDWSEFGSASSFGGRLRPTGSQSFTEHQIHEKRRQSTGGAGGFFTNNSSGDLIFVVSEERTCNDSSSCGSGFACINGICIRQFNSAQDAERLAAEQGVRLPDDPDGTRPSTAGAGRGSYNPNTGSYDECPEGPEPIPDPEPIPLPDCGSPVVGGCAKPGCGMGQEPGPGDEQDPCCFGTVLETRTNSDGDTSSSCVPVPDVPPPSPGLLECDYIFQQGCECEEICDNGTCVGFSDCTAGAECCPGRQCDSQLKQCFTPCTDDADCPAGTRCENGRCVEICTSDSDCPRGYRCKNGVCSPYRCPEDACRQGEVCIDGLCVPAESCSKFCDDYKKANGVDRAGCLGYSCDECEVCQSEPGIPGLNSCQKIEEAYDLRSIPCYCDPEPPDKEKCEICNTETGDFEFDCTDCFQECTVSSYLCPCGETVGPVTVKVPTPQCGGTSGAYGVGPGAPSPVCQQALAQVKALCKDKSNCCDIGNERGCNSHNDCGTMSIKVGEDETNEYWEYHQFQCGDGRSGSAGVCGNAVVTELTFPKS